MTERMQRQHTQPTKDTTNHNTFHDNNTQTQLTTHPHRTPTIPTDDGDDYDGRASSSRHRRCGASFPGMTINVAVLPSPSPDQQRRPEKRRRVYRQPQEKRPRYCGGRDGGAGALGPSPDEGGTGGSGTRRFGSVGRRRRMLVHDCVTGDQEGGEGSTATGVGGSHGGEENGGKTAVIPSLVGLRWR